jgi:hypothetical protein
MTDVTIHVNCSDVDVELGEAGADWVELDTANDKIILSNGSVEVADGEVIPGETALNLAATQVSVSEAVTVDKYFLADANANLLKEINNMGNVDAQYVMAFDFDGATASEPVLEAWDDSDLDSIFNHCLGGNGSDEESAIDSWYKGICTTTSAPGDDWTGVNLAGSGLSNIVYLNDGNGALSVATTLYSNLKVVIPANPSRSGAESPILCVKWNTN